MTTLADVARAAGVSTATASRVLNDQANVDPALAARVREARAALGYQPSAAARTLRTRRSRVWALVLADIRNEFFTEMLRGVEDVAHRAGYAMVVSNADHDPDREAACLRLALAEQVCGVIMTPVASDQPALGELTGRGVPVVTVDRRSSDDGLDRVLIDNAEGARAAVAHLLRSGSERVACIAGPGDTTTGRDRLRGYLDALHAAGIEPDPALVVHADFRESGGRAAAAELLGLARPPDALLVGNNHMTMGALHAIAAAGLAVPDDVAVVGFGDHSWARLVHPPLTTVAQPAQRLGREAADMVISRLDGYHGPAREVVLPATLRVRASSARSR